MSGNLGGKRTGSKGKGFISGIPVFESYGLFLLGGVSTIGSDEQRAFWFWLDFIMWQGVG